MKNIKWAMGFLRDKYLVIVVGLFLVICNTCFELLQLGVQKEILNEIVYSYSAKGVLIQIFFLLFTHVATSILFFVIGILFHKICYQWRENVIGVLILKIQKLPMQDLKSKRISKLTVLFADIERLGEELFELPYKLGDVIKLLIISVMIILIDFRIWILLCLLNLGVILYLNIVSSKLHKIGQEIIQCWYHLMTHFEEGISGVHVIISNNYQNIFTDILEKLFLNYKKQVTKEQNISSWILGVSTVVRWGGVLIALLMAGKGVVVGHLSIGTYYLLFQCSNQFLELFKKINDHILAVIKTSIKIQKIRDTIHEMKELNFEEGIVLEEPIFSIEFEDVDFSYTEEKEILHNFTQHIKIGCKNAIVGESGSGKSTLIDLLMKNYNPTRGKCIINNNVLLQDISLNSWISKINTVYQDGYIFQDTVRNNILLGRQNISDIELMKICECVMLKQFIANLPMGLDEILDERGTSISGGQRQRLFIARALVQSSEILVLDESTTGLDDALQEEVQKKLDKLYEHKTLIIISHRHAVIDNAENIIFLKEQFT